MDTSTPAVDYSSDGRVARIMLNRPHALNAVVPELVAGLVDALSRAIGEGVEAAILAGRGRAFCAGFDLKYDRGERSELTHRRQLEQIQDVTRLIRRAEFPVITAVHGYALGNGCEFALAGDVVIAASDTQFGFPEISWGLSVTGGVSRLLVQAIGQYRAKELLFFGERFTAEQALEWGLVTRVVAGDDLLAEAERSAKALLSRPRAALLRAKRAVDLASGGGLDAAYAIEIEHALLASRSEEAGRAIRTFGDTEQ